MELIDDLSFDKFLDQPEPLNEQETLFYFNHLLSAVLVLS
jgi:hypothetical protein